MHSPATTLKAGSLLNQGEISYKSSDLNVFQAHQLESTWHTCTNTCIPILTHIDIMSTVKKEAEHSFYPGSKIVYDEPNKAQATGKAQVQKGKVDISDPSVPEARDGASF